MDKNLRKLKNQLKRLLYINTPEIETVLEQSILQLSQTKKYASLDISDFALIAQYFDRLIVKKLKYSGRVEQNALLFYLKHRLNRQFLTNNTPKFIKTVYQKKQKIFLDNLTEKGLVLLQKKTNLLLQFQKKWDEELLTLIRSEKVVEHENAIDYYFDYLSNLETIKKLQTRLSFKFKNYSEAEYAIPFQETFTEFIKITSEENFTFQQNSDAFFIAIFKKRLTDFKRTVLTKKAKNEPSRPSEIDITAPSEADYLLAESKFSHFTNEYLAYLPTAIKALGNNCRELLRLKFFEGWTGVDIANYRNRAPQTINEQLGKCEKKLRTLLENLMK